MKNAIRFMLGFVVGLVLLLALAGIVNAAPQCGPLEQVLAGLDERFHEKALWEGLDGKGGRTILTVAPDGSTWTALYVTEATACIVAAGEAWRVGSEMATAPGTEG